MSGKVNIDFDVLDNNNPYYISIVDQSNWATLINNTAYIDITLPGYSKPIRKYFDKQSLNTYNSFSLELSCIDDCKEKKYEIIPDGIYCFVVSSTCENFSTSKKFIRTNNLELELNKYIVSKTSCLSDVNKHTVQKINELKFLIKTAEAHVMYDNIKTAQEFYEHAVNQLDKLKNNC